jgi:antitoxin CptB
MEDTMLALYDRMLNENDHDLYQWVTGQAQTPPEYTGLIGDIQTQVENQPVGQV